MTAPDAERGGESGQRVTHYPVDAAGEWMTAAGAHQGTRDDCPTCRPLPQPEPAAGGQAEETCGGCLERGCGLCGTPAPALPVGGDAEGLREWLTVRHYIGRGCGSTTASTSCSNCYGGRPDAEEVVTVVEEWIAAREAENWDVMHEALCQRGKFCSAHKPGHWPTLVALVAAIAREAAERALVEAADDMDRFRAETYGPDIFRRPDPAEYARLNVLMKRELGWQTDRIGADCYDRAIKVQAQRLRDRAASLGDGSGT